MKDKVVLKVRDWVPSSDWLQSEHDAIGDKSKTLVEKTAVIEKIIARRKKDISNA